MLEKGKIGVHQFMIIVLVFTIGSSILVAPSGLVHQAKQDGWIAEAFAMLIGLLLIILYYSLAKQYPKSTLTEYNEILLGKWLGKFISLLYITYFFILAALLLREIGDFITTQIMPETPIQAIEILFIAIVIMGTRLGLEPLVRSAEIFFPWVLLLFVFLVIAIVPQLRIENLQPIFGDGFRPILKGTFPALGLPYAELCVFLMIIPFVSNVQKGKQAFLIGTFLGGLMLITISLLTIMTIGVGLAERQIYPSYVLAKKINVGKFIERIEAIMAGIWFLTIYFKLTLCFYASTLGLAQTFGMRDLRCLTIPLAIILIWLSNISSPNIVYFNNFLATIWTPYSLTFGLLLPVILLSLALWKKKRVQN